MEKEMKEVEFFLIYAKAIKDRVDNQPPNISLFSSPKLDGMPHTNTVGNPTYKLAAKYIELLERQEINKKMVALVEDFYNRLQEEKYKILLEARWNTVDKYRKLSPRERGRGRPSWRDYATVKYCQIKDEEPPSYKTIDYWWREIVVMFYIFSKKNDFWELKNKQ